MAAPVIRRALKAFAVCGALLTLTACATASLPAKMTAAPGTVAAATPGDKAYKALRVLNVQGGSETNPLLASDVSNADFRLALEASLRQIEYLAADQGGAFLITASIVDLQQPFAGLDMSVTAKVRYTVVPAGGGAPIYDETLATTGTATMGDAFMGVERLRMANEAAVKGNIETFIKKLSATLR